jgi:hypothetical protein
MFKITPINDKSFHKECADACGAQYIADFFAYSMIDNDSGELMGFSQFEINENGGFISDLREKIGFSDDEAMFILGRATMNFIDLCGSHVCYAKKDAADEKLLHAIGFKSTVNDLLFCDMTGMFDGNCSGH